MSRQVVIGPPGTGKTTYLMGIVQNLIRNEWTKPDEIAFVSYSRAAVETARDRIRKATGRAERDFRYFRTLHSMFGSLLGYRMEDYLKPSDLKTFYRLAGYMQPETCDNDLLDRIEEPSRGDLLMRMLDYKRQTMQTTWHALALADGRVEIEEFNDFEERYAEFRNTLQLVDHTDILERAMERGLQIPVDILIVDEAQDLSPLQVALITPSVEGARKVWVAGDDDQSIYQFQGSSPAWLMSLWANPSWERKLLDLSHRCPEPVRQLGEVVINRCTTRIAKTYRSKHNKGSVVRATWAYAVHKLTSLTVEETGYVLARTGSFCANACNILFDSDVPYRIDNARGGANPLGQSAIMLAVEVLSALRDGHDVPMADMLRVLNSIPVRNHDYVLPTTKAQLERAPLATVGRDNAARFGFTGLIRAIDRDLWDVLRVKYPPRRDQRDELQWLRRQWELNGSRWPSPRVTVMTWHASKGREADVVVLDPSLNKVCMSTLDGPDADGEHRCAYVAVTRSKRDLIIVDKVDKSAGEYDFA